MPVAVSRKQYRMMMAIAHGDHVKPGPRGRPPKEVAAKYTSPGKDAPERSGEDRGGNWDEQSHGKHHKKESEKHGGKETKEGKKHRDKAAHHIKEHRKKLKKAYEDFYKGSAAAAIVMDDNNRILLGSHESGGLAFPGGHMDPEDLNNFAVTALRELKEEAGLIGLNPNKIWEGKKNGNDVMVFLVDSYKGKLTPSKELKNLKWVEPQEIEWSKVRDCCKEPLKHIIESKMGKSLKGMVALEALQKNIIRQKGTAVFEVTHGDALKLVGNGLFRKIKAAIKDMQDEDFRDIKIDTYTLSVRKHMSDVYSGRVSDGHKVVYQFTNKSLPEMTAALMSVFEWYLPEDEKIFDILDEKALPNDAIHGGINELAENYKRHNIGNIYEEMENIREQMRNGMAIDLQQIEARIMKLFDKLEEFIRSVADKHNMLAEKAGLDIDEIEKKLRELQSKIDEIGRKPEKVEAFSANPPDKDKIIDSFYPYLSRPKIEIMPNGKITIVFESDWQHLEKENFLSDMRAKVIKKGTKHG